MKRHTEVNGSANKYPLIQIPRCPQRQEPDGNQPHCCCIWSLAIATDTGRCPHDHPSLTPRLILKMGITWGQERSSGKCTNEYSVPTIATTPPYLSPYQVPSAPDAPACSSPVKIAVNHRQCRFSRGRCPGLQELAIGLRKNSDPTALQKSCPFWISISRVAGW